MNITFLIGNGFDLNMGLKTRYVDFLNDYLQDASSDSDGEIKEFKDDIKRQTTSAPHGSEPLWVLY